MAASTSPHPSTYAFVHPTLGSLTGLVSPETPDVVRFRAIPYATFPGRFQHSVLREDLEGLSRDFTKQGYACPHTFSLDDIHSGGPHSGQEPVDTSEFESLILDVNVPRSHLEALSKESVGKLPVMTYIHGGGFMLGKIDAQHNTAYMAQHSMSISKPVISAAIQYRLGALGFMAIPDGGKNFGLKDQRNALLWIQKFIDGFGGDEGRVSLFGESAGGFSICCHMLSHPPPSGPLFNRVMIMSGILGPVTAPSSEEDATEVFKKICTNLSIQECGENALTKLHALDVQSLVTASDIYTSQGNLWRPVSDPSFFRSDITWDKVPELLGECEWVDEIIIGNTGFEGQANLGVANSLTPQSFLEHLKRELSDEAANKVMKTYGMALDMDQNTFLTPAMRWFGDLVFDAPIHVFAKHITAHTSKRIYRYVFDIRNPFPNAPFYQQAHHWADVYFLFRAMQFRFPHQWLKDVSDRHAELWINFACGEKPWSEYKHGVVMVADEREGWVEKTMEEYETMSRVKWDRLDSLWQAWSEKKGAKWVPFDMAALKP
ncbi:alpha/beta-hydrolase [Ophiobolus disseminans]|uniref:Carboxylic ester hydrolase n=1 Tax=Ophiobolus disseminans TaxID=1469910 RepID=A0A6A7A108_9PLEO|nr:alpha/beta-hydrolase [Ophiobolus disseminans]